MAVPNDQLLPGLLTPADAVALQLAAGQTEMDRQAIAKWLMDAEDEFPVKLTAYDSATGACSGTLQTWDENGRRIDHSNGVTFSPTWLPLFPTGNGTMPPPSFPVEVTVQKRIRRTAGDFVFEFPWVCACTFYSGTFASGVGSGTVLGRDLCANGIAASGTATITAPGCAALNGQVITLSYSNLFDWWSGTLTVGDYVFELIMTVNANGARVSMFSGRGPHDMTACTLGVAGTHACGPPFTIAPTFQCTNSQCPTDGLLVSISIP